MAKKKKRLEEIEWQKSAAGAELKKTPTPKKPTPKRVQGSSVAGQGFTHFNNAPRNVPYKTPVETGTERTDRYRREIRTQNPSAVTGAERMDRSRADSERRRKEYERIAKSARDSAPYAIQNERLRTAPNDAMRRAETAVAQIMADKGVEEAERLAPSLRQAGRAVAMKEQMLSGMSGSEYRAAGAYGNAEVENLPEEIQSLLFRHLEERAQGFGGLMPEELREYFSIDDIERMSRAYNGNAIKSEDPLGTIANIYDDTATMYDYMAKIEGMPTDIRQSFDKVMQVREDFRHEMPEWELLYDYVGGGKELDRAISAYERFRNSANAEQTAERFASRAEVAPGTVYAENLATPFYSLGAAVVEPFGIAGEWFDRLTGRSPFKTGDPNAPFYALSDQSARVRGATSQAILGDNPNFLRKAENVLYSGATSAMDNGARILAGYLMGNPYASLALAGSGAFSSAYRDATARGAEPVRAALYGGANAALEAATEKLPLDRLLTISDKNVLMDILKSALTEVGEEEASFFGGVLADAVIMGQNSKNQIAIRQYMENGMTEAQARQAALKDVLGEAAETALTSAVSSGLMTGTNRAIQGAAQSTLKKLSPGELIDLFYGGEPSSAVETEESDEYIPDTPQDPTLSEEETVGQEERWLDELYPRDDGARYSYAGRQSEDSRVEELRAKIEESAEVPVFVNKSGKFYVRRSGGGVRLVRDSASADKFTNAEMGAVNDYVSRMNASAYKRNPLEYAGTEMVSIPRKMPYAEKKEVLDEISAIQRGYGSAKEAHDADEQRKRKQFAEDKVAVQGSYFEQEARTGEPFYYEGEGEVIPNYTSAVRTIVREAKRLGAAEVHTSSKTGSKFSSSVYLRMGEVDVRISEHNLPKTDERTARGSRWGNEIILTPRALIDLSRSIRTKEDMEKFIRSLFDEDGIRYSADTGRTAAGSHSHTRLTPGKVTFDGDEKKLTRDQRTNMAGLRVVAEALNVPIHVFESKVDPETGKRVGANGWYDPKDGSIHIDLHAGADGAGTMMFTAAHEVVHLIRDSSYDEYRKLVKFLNDAMSRYGRSLEDFASEYEAAETNYPGYNHDVRTEEAVARSFEYMLAKGRVQRSLERLSVYDRSLWEKIKRFFSDLSAKLRRLYSGKVAGSKEAQFVEQMGREARRIEDAFIYVVEKAAQERRAYNNTEDSKGRRLTAKQGSFFEKSAVRDDSGRLRTVYHGSVAAFNEFSFNYLSKNGLGEGLGFYFTSKKAIAQRYASGTEDNPDTERGQAYEVYLNVTKPLHYAKETMSYEDFERFVTRIKDYGKQCGVQVDVSPWKVFIGHMDDASKIKAIADLGFTEKGASVAQEFLAILTDTTGYDGQIVKNPSWGGDQTIYLAFFPEQIKLVSNKTPTTSRDIRYSMRDGELPFTLGEEDLHESQEDAIDRLESLAAEAHEVGREELGRLVWDTDSAIRHLEREVKSTDSPYVEDIVSSASRLRESAIRLYDYWRKTSQKRSGTEKTLDKATRKVALDIRKTTGTKLTVKEIQDELREIVGTMYQSYTKAFWRAKDAAKAIFSGVTGGEDTLYEQYAEARAYFRGRTITISQSAAADIPDFRDLQKRNFGRVRIKVAERGNIDADWDEISGRLPGIVDVDAYNQSDMLYAIIEGLDQIYSSKDEPAYSESDIDNMAQEYANKLIVDMSMLEFRDETQAEQREAFVRDLSEHLSSGDDAEATAEKIDQYVYQLNDSLLRGKENAASQVRQGLRALRKLGLSLREKGVTDEDVGEAIKEARKTLQALNMADDPGYALGFIDRANERYEQLKQDKKDAQIRGNIYRNFKRLLAKVSSNTDAKHVPETMRKAIVEVLASIDPSSRQLLKGGEATDADKYFLAKLSALKSVLSDSAQENSDIYVIDGVMLDIPPGMQEALDETHKNLSEAALTHKLFSSGTPLSKMARNELILLNKTLNTLVECVSKANKILSGETGRRIDVFAKVAIQDYSEYKPDDKKHLVDRHLTTPIYFFEQLGDGARFIWDGLVRAQGKWADNRKAVRDFAHATWSRAQIQEWEKHTHKFTTEGGEEVTLSDSQIMSLYCLSRRKQGMKHLLGGGIRVDEVKAAKIKVGAENAHLTADDVQKLTKLLSKEQIDVAEKIQEFMTKVGGKWGNEISLKRFGYKKYTERLYFPIRTDPATRDSTADRVKNTIWQVLNYGFTKKTAEKAPQAAMLGSIFDEYANHMEKMARHNAYSLAILDAMRWFNYSVSDEDGKNHKSVHGTMEKAFEKTATEYFLNLMSDISSPRTSETDPALRIPRWLNRQWKKFAVYFSLATMVKQPLSYVRASYVLDTKAMARAFGKIPGSKFQREKKQMYAHNGIARIKGTGYMDAYNARGFKDEVRHDKGKLTFHGEDVRWGDIAMKGAAWMDEQTWVRIWIACKWQACEYKSEEFDSVATITKATQLFNETIFKTQVVESQLSNSPWRRNNNLFTSMFMPFSTEGNVSYNVLMQGYRLYQNEVRRTGKAQAKELYRKRIRRGVAAYMAGSVADALIESIIGAYRDDDEFQNFFEKFLEKLLGEGVLQGDLIGLVGGNLFNSINPLSKVPGFAVVVDALLAHFKGYTNERIDTTTLVKLMEVVSMWDEFIRIEMGDKDVKPTKLTAYGKMNLGGAIVETLRNADRIFGTGAGNVARTIQSTWNNIANIYNDTLDEGEERISKITKYDSFTENGVIQAFKDGYLTITETAEEIQLARKKAGKELYSENELYWKLKELETWDEEKGRGLGKTDALDLAVLSGDAESIMEAAEEIQAHSDNPPENPAESAVLRVYKDSMKDERNEVYEGKTLNRDKAYKLLTEVAGLRADQAYTALEKAEYEILHGDSTGFSVYSGVYDTMVRGGDIKNAVQKLMDTGFAEEQVMSETKGLVTDAYKTGVINKSQATTIMQKYYDMDKKELYQYFGRAEYEAKEYGDSYSAYNEVYSLVPRGGDISGQVKLLTKNGYSEQEVYEAAANEAHRLFKEGEISEQKASDLMRKYLRTTENMSASDKQAYFKEHGKLPEDGVLRELTENELYWKMDEWSWKKQNPNGEYTKYRNWYSAVESGDDIRKTVRDYESHGVSQTTLKSMLTSKYKQAYLDAYFSGDSGEASRIRKMLVKAYRALGMSSNDAYDKISEWVKEERKNRR